MEETLITFETAILASTKNVDLKSNFAFWYNSDYHKDGEEIEWLKKVKSSDILKMRESANFEIGNPFIKRYSQSLLQKWLRETHKINLYLLPAQKNSWYWQITLFNPDNCITDFELKINESFETALEKGLVEALKLIK